MATSPASSTSAAPALPRSMSLTVSRLASFNCRPGPGTIPWIRRKRCRFVCTAIRMCSHAISARRPLHRDAQASSRLFRSSASMATCRQFALSWHEKMMWFDAGAFAGPLRGVYPVQPGEASENPEAKRRIKNLLDASGMIDALTLIVPTPADEDAIRRVHTARLLDEVKEKSAGYGGQLGASSYLGTGGYEIAALAAGATMA